VVEGSIPSGGGFFFLLAGITLSALLALHHSEYNKATAWFDLPTRLILSQLYLEQSLFELSYQALSLLGASVLASVIFLNISDLYFAYLIFAGINSLINH
jgi:hypothetical protein